MYFFKVREKLSQHCSINGYKNVLAGFSCGNESGVFQHPVVMRHGRLAKMKFLIEIGAAQLPAFQQHADDPVAGFVSQCFENFNRLFLKIQHRFNISKFLEI